jgi:hypothetical protein
MKSSHARVTERVDGVEEVHVRQRFGISQKGVSTKWRVLNAVPQWSAV